MAGRYLRRFVCIDCGEPTERMWQARRPKVCVPCGHIRFEIATDAARAAVAEHARLCRLRLAQRRQEAAQAAGGPVVLPRGREALSGGESASVG